MNLEESKYKDIKDYLQNSIVTPEAEKELKGYLEDAFERFMYTFDMIPDTHSNNNLLELGSNPYFLTLMIKRYKKYQIKLANYFGEGHSLHQQCIKNKKYNEEHIFDFLQFNVEKEIFPFKGKEFGVVLCCEILEHLIEDPIFMLSEIHRILDDNGILILTTPNVCRQENVERLINGENIYDPYSGYGIYGRHNREYTVMEIEEILSKTGFEVQEVTSRNIHGQPNSHKDYNRFNGDNIFAVAKKTGPFKYYYPSYLFRSINKRLIINHPYVRMGENDSVQLGDGWYHLEDWGKDIGYIRWTSGKAEAYLKCTMKPKILKIVAYVGNGNIKCNIKVNSHNDVVHTHNCIFEPTQNDYEIDLINMNMINNSDVLRVTFEVDTTWNPVNHGSTDDRELGIAVKSILVE